ncbi:alpha/beta fold hydrolase [Jiangella mangrovi]|uniref:Pimeloyl-ACP methyl ester carboxylesterase n=1 Tax=Jiangella mangrovi TaxID=1524084 RepID=A0A7W9LNV6_9ACTN|nr:alpha/beta hydrolase [Jiangella mangrovi]MBB5790676.1 pimeloyl-ACP methyl ester carboxylesterase [Jiangella mangrovi]
MSLPVVLIHAFPLTPAVFDGVTERLPGTTVIAPALRGFGGPDAAGEPSLDTYADDVAAELDRRGVERAVVGGLSLGGYVTMAMLRRHPDRVAGVILMDTKASEDTDEARANRLRMADAVEKHGTRALRPMLDTLLGATTHRDRPGLVTQVTAWLDAARPDGVAWAQRAMAARPPSFDTLHDAAARGLEAATVVVGAEDTMTGPDEAAAMASALGGVTVHVVDEAGHLSPLERPDVVAAILRETTLSP